MLFYPYRIFRKVLLFFNRVSYKLFVTKTTFLPNFKQVLTQEENTFLSQPVRNHDQAIIKVTSNKQRQVFDASIESVHTILPCVDHALLFRRSLVKMNGDPPENGIS